MISQIKFGINTPIGEIPLGFTFAGIYLLCFISFATVYMGGQTESMLFLLLGWGESIKNRPHEVNSTSTHEPPRTNKKTFNRIIL
jgi:hypothetical protein